MASKYVMINIWNKFNLVFSFIKITLMHSQYSRSMLL